MFGSAVLDGIRFPGAFNSANELLALNTNNSGLLTLLAILQT
jgi:hypothetical protein